MCQLQSYKGVLVQYMELLMDIIGEMMLTWCRCDEVASGGVACLRRTSAWIKHTRRLMKGLQATVNHCAFIFKGSDWFTWATLQNIISFLFEWRHRDVEERKITGGHETSGRWETQNFWIAISSIIAKEKYNCVWISGFGHDFSDEDSFSLLIFLLKGSWNSKTHFTIPGVQGHHYIVCLA